MNNGGPAFPVKGGMCFMLPPGTKDQYEAMATDVKREYEGMTLRDWFAGQALNGIISSLDSKILAKVGRAGKAGELDDAIVKSAYGCADAMIAERDKEVEDADETRA